MLALALSTGGGSGAGVTDPARFSLPAIQGDGQIELADYRGKPLVVNFFAVLVHRVRSEELPGFAKVSKEHHGEVQFVGVASL